MKRARLLILTALVMIALVVTVVPALAHYPTEYNWTFMGDKNGDNVPDKWNVKGEVFRVCNHAYTAYTQDACMMVFPPSSKGAALYQRVSVDDYYPAWIVSGEESVNAYIGSFYGATKALDNYRAYYGARLTFDDGLKVLVYDYVPGGHNPFDGYDFYADIDQWFTMYALDYGPYNLSEYAYGFLVRPGDGYLAVDEVLPEHY